MIDHLLRYADQASAMDALPAYAIEGIEPGERHWDASCVISAVGVYRVTGTETVDVPDVGPIAQEIRAYLPGWYIIIARPARDAALEGAACVLIADRETGAVLYTITTSEDLATLRVEPVFAGSVYPFGAPIIADG